eukprot:IDg6461t1
MDSEMMPNVTRRLRKTPSSTGDRRRLSKGQHCCDSQLFFYGSSDLARFLEHIGGFRLLLSSAGIILTDLSA